MGIGLDYCKLGTIDHHKEPILESSQALEQFLIQVERRAFTMAELATGNRDDALDLVQDAMLGLVKRYGDRTSEEWPPLFYRILQSRIRDWYRRTQVRNRFRVWLGRSGKDPGQETDPIQEAVDHKLPNMVDQLASHVAMDDLLSSLRDLPMRQQQAFLLRTWEGLSVSETAYAMGCSEGSVKTHYSRAIHRLKERLEDFRT
ncbi:MAG: RNA polymerase sigma factor [gamma proteobacterium symbiont of Ctena orbiculata]|nr:MAG: RNA polymerase sigma factor [gamma proteobacterium symbiont of Ctena orbiculata]PVV23380.1 MAG: RNA polymerase sigma factor [gamma proteobacterium symbiont of Ctena orbiculata]